MNQIQQIQENRMLEKADILVKNKRVRRSTVKESRNIWMVGSYSTPKKWYVVRWNEELDGIIEMASKQAYECFVCKKNGFANIRVLLDGRTADGKTIYKNEDMSPHQHKEKQQHVSAVNSANVQKNVLPSEDEPGQRGITTASMMTDVISS